MIHIDKVRPYFFLICLIGILALMSQVFWPFLKPLALAAVFAVVLQGLHRRVSTVVSSSWPGTAAFLTLLTSIILIILPLSLIGTLVVNEAQTLHASFSDSGAGRSVLADVILQADIRYGTLVPGLHSFAQNASANIDAYTKAGLEWIVGNAANIFAQLSQFLLSLFIFFIALYYLLKDGKHVRQVLIKLSPLSDTEDIHVLDRLELAVNSVIKGNLTIALIQGVMMTIGLTLFGVPSSILWGTVAALAALIPGVGTGLIIIPAVGYLFLTGATISAAGLLAWGVLAVGLIDNFLGPRLVGRGMNIHPLLILLSVLGGLAYFGLAGIFLGPLTTSLLFALLSIYTDISRPQLKENF